MATADRLYEAACECRELESRLDRLVRDVQEKERELEALSDGASRLLEALDLHEHDGPPPPAGVRGAAEALRELLRSP